MSDWSCPKCNLRSGQTCADRDCPGLAKAVGQAFRTQRSSAGGEAMDDTHGGIFWVRADGGGLVSATPGEACDEIKRLRAENARLREALENSAIMIQGCYDAPTNPDSLPQMLLYYIRAALKVKP